MQKLQDITFTGKTDTGLKRDHNEDNYVSTELWGSSILLCCIDGVGGMAGGAGRQQSDIVAQTRAAAASQSKFWWQCPISVGAQISIPLFAGFKTVNQLREVNNQMSQLNIQREYAEQGIRLQVEQAINTLITARETMLSNERTVEQAQKAYDISYTRYNAGAGTILELNSSQLSLTQAQLSYSQSIYDYLSAYANYQKTLGNEEL